MEEKNLYLKTRFEVREYLRMVAHQPDNRQIGPMVIDLCDDVDNLLQENKFLCQRISDLEIKYLYESKGKSKDG